MTQDLAPQAASGADEDDEISLLDLLQVVVDNLRLLVLGPLAAGLVALGITYVMTPVYTAKVVFITVSGIKDILSIPHSTKNSANSGKSDGA